MQDPGCGGLMPIIAIDFDGCIVEDQYPEIGPIMPGAKESINALYDAGFCIIINSCRAREAERNMETWLDAVGIHYCHINENCRERIVKYRTDCRKISADCYIDDKGLFSPDFALRHDAWGIILNIVFAKFGKNHTRRCRR